MGKIYTKTGDKGTTSLMDGKRVPKYHIRVEAYGTVDELCSYVGTIIAGITNQESRTKENLLQVQRDLFQIEALLSEPEETQFPQFLSSLEKRISVLEKEIDAMTEELPELTNFILPGGTTVAAQLHVARTLTRRAERRLVELMHTEKVEELLIQYLNRLSDYFFTLSRYSNFIENVQDNTWSR